MPDATDEQWVPVAGFEGLYEVSDRGRVRSLDRATLGSDGKTYHRKGRVLKQAASEYQMVTLWKDIKQHGLAVHRIVLESFVGPRPDGMVTRHLNGDHRDNRLCNLVYGTQSENMYDKVRHGRHHNAVKTHCSRGHEFTEWNTSRNKQGQRSCYLCSRRRERKNAA